MKIGRNIQYFLEREGLSQNDLARRAHISQSGLSSIINDQVSPKIDTVEDIAAALHCNFTDLFQTPGHAAAELIDVPLEAGETVQKLTYDESRLLNLYGLLNESGKRFLMQTAVNLVQTPEMRQDGSIASMA